MCKPLFLVIMNQVKIQANANIALIKYWGKRDENLFLPTKSSLSVTLSELKTFTNLEKIDSNQDEIFIDKKAADQKTFTNIVRFLDLFRKIYDVKNFFKIETENKFPTAAGLASSASGFAALAYGLNKICLLNLNFKEVSILARQGSGSACRSLHGGFVIWHKGNFSDGLDSCAQQLFDHNYWPEFCILVVIVCAKEKQVGSRNAMQNSVKTSLFYQEWVQESESRIPRLIKALEQKNFDELGQLAQEDCLGMHKTIQTSIPPISYFQDATLQIMDTVNNLREQGLSCYFTIDAGPNVKVLCLKKNLESIKNKLNKIYGVQQIIECRVGGRVQENFSS
jgi:diphosphomevalonate decarboxylase